jgi:hypothetical protein
MRVLVVGVLAATLVGCASFTPQQSAIHTAAKGKIIVGMKKRPRHHKRGSGNTKPAISARKAEPHSSDLNDKSAAKRIKEIISAKLGNPAFIDFPDIVRGKAPDSFCGVVEVKGASGEGRYMPFVVRSDDVYIVNGNDDRRAATAIHIMCDR